MRSRAHAHTRMCVSACRTRTSMLARMHACTQSRLDSTRPTHLRHQAATARQHCQSPRQGSSSKARPLLRRPRRPPEQQLRRANCAPALPPSRPPALPPSRPPTWSLGRRHRLRPLGVQPGRPAPQPPVRPAGATLLSLDCSPLQRRVARELGMAPPPLVTAAGCGGVAVGWMCAELTRRLPLPASVALAGPVPLPRYALGRFRVSLSRRHRSCCVQCQLPFASDAAGASPASRS